MANAVVSGTELTDVDTIQKLLKEHWQNQIAIVWSTEDVIGRAKERDIELTEDQALGVLHSLERRFDANIGISWEVIDIYIDWELQT
jgi:hypothetical protein